MPLYEVLLQQAFSLVLWTTMPIVLTALLGGLVIGLFQSLTQLNDSTFSLAPRLAGAILMAFVIGSWMIEQDVAFIHRLIGHMPELLNQSWS